VKYKLFNQLLMFLSSIVLSAQAVAVSVDCNSGPPGALSMAVASAAPGTTIDVKGTCHESVAITTNDLTLVGNSSGSKAIISGFFPGDRLVVDGAVRVNIIGFVVEKGVFGIQAVGNASFSLTDVDVADNILGIEINKGSTASVSGDVSITGSRVFGLQVLTGSKLNLEENATLTIANNFLGSQVSINSTLFAGNRSKIMVMDNTTIGFSVNTGSTAMLFNADFHSKGNGLDGLDVVSHSNFEVDGESTVISESNSRDGISIDNSTLNMFGFFSSAAGLPRIISHANTGNGILVESTSKFDVGRNSSVASHHNGDAGVRLDDGSSAVIQRAEIHSNNGVLPRNDDHDEDKNNDHNRAADVVVTFGSRVSFNQEADNDDNVTPNMIGLALCDRSSLSRGDVHCKR